VEPASFKFAEKAIKSDGRMAIEAVGELITGVPLHICEAYYGIDISGDPRTFAYATIVVSQQLFGPLPITPKRKVDNAAHYLRSIVERSLDKEIANPSGRDTIVSRLVESYRKPDADDCHLPRDQVRAFLMGMIVGFVPTNTIAGGHILEMLLRREGFCEQARAAALSGDDDLLKHCLFEAMRFMPLNPGPIRICEKDYILAAGKPRAKKIKKGQHVMASAMSAMMDADKVDRPHEFVPGRPASDYMLFGYGIHWCAGVFIAQSQIAQTFKALLQQPKLERGSGEDKWPRYRGLVPDYQVVRFR
jgi:cytochrome P450